MKDFNEIISYSADNFKLLEQSNDGGSFALNFKNNLVVIVASFGGGWDHVSVSMKNRCPTWVEMCFVKNLFFYENEIVIQYHPAKKDYINIHPFCLHLWRKQDAIIEIPPIWMI